MLWKRIKARMSRNRPKYEFDFSLIAEALFVNLIPIVAFSITDA